MTPEDKKFFIADMKDLQWKDIFEVFGLGIRKYIGRETLDTLPAARAHYRKLEILHYIILFFVYSFLIYSSYIILRFYGWVDYAKGLSDHVLNYYDGFEVASSFSAQATKGF